MTTYETMKKSFFQKFAQCPINELKEEAVKLMDNFEDGATIVFNILLDYLETKMTEEEYTEFCDSL